MSKQRITQIKRTRIYKSIEKDLLDQLERNGTYGEHFKNLVLDYMSLYVTKTLLRDDINDRGVYTEYNNGGGQKGTRKNDSVELALKVNAQMLKILSELDIKPSQAVMAGETL